MITFLVVACATPAGHLLHQKGADFKKLDFRKIREVRLAPPLSLPPRAALNSLVCSFSADLRSISTTSVTKRKKPRRRRKTSVVCAVLLAVCHVPLVVRPEVLTITDCCVLRHLPGECMTAAQRTARPGHSCQWVLHCRWADREGGQPHRRATIVVSRTRHAPNDGKTEAPNPTGGGHHQHCPNVRRPSVPDPRTFLEAGGAPAGCHLACHVAFGSHQRRQVSVF